MIPFISRISIPALTVVSVDERPPASFFLRQANARSEASKRGDCLSEASSSPFSGTKEVSRRKNAALILSFGIFSFASRRKKSTLYNLNSLRPDR